MCIRNPVQRRGTNPVCKFRSGYLLLLLLLCAGRLRHRLGSRLRGVSRLLLLLRRHRSSALTLSLRHLGGVGLLPPRLDACRDLALHHGRVHCHTWWVWVPRVHLLVAHLALHEA